MNYLIDTNICIYFMKGMYNLSAKFNRVENFIFISEITVAELKFGVANSEFPKKNANALANFMDEVKVVPIYGALEMYATEKARLRKLGQMVDDFDLLIGVTAVHNEMVMVTNNTKHLGRINNISIADWTQEVV